LADGYADLISTSCSTVIGLNHRFRLFPKNKGFISNLRAAGGKINSVVPSYGFISGNGNLLSGFSSLEMPSLS
jgi:hypothetical protein